MTLNKIQGYFLLQALLIISIFSSQIFWIFSKTTEGEILYFDKASDYGDLKSIDIMRVSYMVNYSTYEETYLRNGTPDFPKGITVRYSIFFPNISRPNNFVGNWLSYFIIYFIPFVVSTMLFFVPNDILPKGSLFFFKIKYPFIKVY